MTSRADRAEHAVMSTELEQANRTGQPPVGLCGAIVDPAPLGATARHVCRPCREAVARRRRAAHPEGRLPTAPWTLLVQWYEALVRLLRGGLPDHAPKALPAGPSAAPLALPAPRSAPPARETGGRHRRD